MDRAQRIEEAARLVLEANAPAFATEDAMRALDNALSLLRAALAEPVQRGVQAERPGPDAWDAHPLNAPDGYTDNPPAPDNASVRDVLLYALRCARAWQPGVRVLGNLRACDLSRALTEVLAEPVQPQPAPGEAVACLWAIRDVHGDFINAGPYKSERSAQKDIWHFDGGGAAELAAGAPHRVIPLYATPPLAPDAQVRLDPALDGLTINPRDMAVWIVDAMHGYTVEASNDKARHSAEYDDVERLLRKMLRPPPAPEAQAFYEAALAYFDADLARTRAFTGEVFLDENESRAHEKQARCLGLARKAHAILRAQAAQQHGEGGA